MSTNYNEIFKEKNPHQKIYKGDDLMGGLEACITKYGITFSSDKTFIKDVIFNNPATIVIWADGTKTVVKAENEVFDPEKGLAMAISKKFFGNKGNYFKVFKKWIPELKMRELYDDVYFEEAYTDVKFNTLTLYFVAPRDLLGEKYKDAESTEICLEMENGNFDVANVSVMFSPTKDGSDYDWFSVTIPDDIIENLIELYKNSGR